MKWFFGAVSVILVAGYIATGVQLQNYSEIRIEQNCPDHRHAHDRWPVAVRTLGVATWPIGVVVRSVPVSHLVCDRFD